MTAAIIEVTLVDVCAVATAIKTPARLALAPHHPSTSQHYAEENFREVEYGVGGRACPPPSKK